MSSFNNNSVSSIDVPDSHTWTLTLTDRQLAFLLESTAQGVSRWEAYSDLLRLVLLKPTVVTVPYNEPITIWPGQLIASITELANRWKWSRITVRSFLEHLEQMELLHRCQLTRCSVITMSIVFPFLSAEDVGKVPTINGEAETAEALRSDESEPGYSPDMPVIPTVEDAQDLRL